MELLEEASDRIHRATKLLTCRAANHQPPGRVPSGKTVCILSPVNDRSERESTASPPLTNKTAYPRTPYPVARPGGSTAELQFASTPLVVDGHSLPMLVTPGAIHFSESEAPSCHGGGSASGSAGRQRQSKVSPTEGRQPETADNSPGLPEGGSDARALSAITGG